MVVAPTVAATSRPPAPAESNTEQYQQALALEHEGKLAEARALLQPLDNGGEGPDKVLDLLGAIDTKILFTAVSAPEKVDYTIVAGDSLGKLAQKFGTTIDLIKKSNNLTRDVIRVGDRLRIYQGHFAVTVSKATNELRLTDNGKFFKRYRVGTGEYSKTPVGDFKIITRLANPPWWRADGKTIPGTRVAHTMLVNEEKTINLPEFYIKYVLELGRNYTLDYTRGWPRRSVCATPSPPRTSRKIRSAFSSTRHRWRRSSAMRKCIERSLSTFVV